MPRASLTLDDCSRVLASEQLVRVAFRDQDVLYLIPLGYVAVAFQVDTAMTTGLWQWESVTGEGIFELVDGSEKHEAVAALQPILATAPDWWRREQGPRMAAGVLVVWRIRPTRYTGCRYAPGNGGAE